MPRSFKLVANLSFCLFAVVFTFAVLVRVAPGIESFREAFPLLVEWAVQQGEINGTQTRYNFFAGVSPIESQLKMTVYKGDGSFQTEDVHQYLQQKLNAAFYLRLLYKTSSHGYKVTQVWENILRRYLREKNITDFTKAEIQMENYLRPKERQSLPRSIQILAQVKHD